MDSKKRRGRVDDRVLNVAPGDDDAPNAGDIPRPPKNLARSNKDMQMGNSKPEPWKNGRAGVNKAWNNYRGHLSSSFSRMTRYQQEQLVERMCLIVTIGVTGLALLLFYSLINRTVRVFLVPAAIVGAWWAAKKIVTPVVLDRLSGLLNPYEQPDEDATLQ
ncbi:MAG TPA: hypothetical protein V6D22_20615 [Candidatus Obscuribacterales bacterium]